MKWVVITHQSCAINNYYNEWVLTGCHSSLVELVNKTGLDTRGQNSAREECVVLNITDLGISLMEKKKEKKDRQWKP